MTQEKDKRAHPRLDTEFAVQLADRDGVLPQGTIVSQSRNISLGGIYCRVNHYVPVLTKLQLTLLLPFRGKKKEVKTQLVRTDAVVVRTIPPEEKAGVHDYEIGCAFLGIEEEAKKSIARYIRDLLEAEMQT
jgi:hypothetical protein